VKITLCYLYEFHKSDFTDNAETKFSIYLNVLNQDCLICIVTRLQTSHLENWDKFSEESFFFSTVSKLALEHTEPSQMGTLDPFSLRVKWQWYKAGCSSAPTGEAKCVQLYFHFLICLHVMLLNKEHVKFRGRLGICLKIWSLKCTSVTDAMFAFNWLEICKVWKECRYYGFCLRW
jgi:hypothetical protein